MSILSSKKQTVHEQGHWEQKTGMTLRSRMLQMACKVKMRTLPWLAIIMGISRHQFSSVQFSHSVVSDSATPWIATYQASLSITNSRSSLRLMPIESVMPSSHLILCHPLLGKYKYKYILVNDPAFGLGNGLMKVHFIVLYFKKTLSHIYISHTVFMLSHSVMSDSLQPHGL